MNRLTNHFDILSDLIHPKCLSFIHPTPQFAENFAEVHILVRLTVFYIYLVQHVLNRLYILHVNIIHVNNLLVKVKFAQKHH